MLWGNNLMLALFPKVWLDVATSVHFYEALLATLAIVVWHFYTVIFDPDVYPMDTAWLTGVSVKKIEEPHAAEPEPREPGIGRSRGRQRDHIQMNETRNVKLPRQLSPLVHLSNNWISLAGVVVVTTATVFWLFLLPTTMRGEVHNPYNGILAFLLLPGLFFLGLLLIPLGIYRQEHAERGSAGLYPANFPPLNMKNLEFRRLLTFVGVTTFANIVIASQLAYGAVSYMETVSFLRPDLPYGDAAGIHGLSELAAFARGVRAVPHRAWRILVCAQQALRHPAGIRGDVPHLRDAHSHARAQLAPRARDLRSLPLAAEVRRRPPARHRQVRRRRNELTDQDRAADEDRRRQSRHRHPRHASGAGRASFATGIPIRSARPSPGSSTTRRRARPCIARRARPRMAKA